ncbi:acetolactate synthase large subunit [Edaphobacter sp. HDX4]|uniref:acetolactate synthase large subunit n=1 Tax=Edaphobacter sp. HDX4 TaxID=2794064 RepID=UPI002FE5504E
MTISMDIHPSVPVDESANPELSPKPDKRSAGVSDAFSEQTNSGKEQVNQTTTAHSHGNHPVKGSDLLVRALENEGVEYIFGVPGEENLDLVESLRSSNIQLIVTRHEQVAGFMAATYGRLTGKAGVCLSTLGPGATNFVTAAAYAYLGGMPMLMITGQKPILKSRQARFQIIDTVSMMRPLTKSAKQVIDAGNIPTLVRDAFRVAQEERPGPVHLELPEDIAGQMTERSTLVPVSSASRPVASDQAIREAAALLQAAQHPLVLIGGGANRPGLTSALSAAVRQLEIPFFNTQMGKGAVTGNSDLYLGTAALSEGDYVHLACRHADLILSVGHDTVEKPPFIMRDSGPKVIHIDFNPADIDQIYFPHVQLIGDIADSLSRLASVVDGEKAWDATYFKRVQEVVLTHIAEGADDPRFPLAPQRIVADVRRVMPEDGVICLDNGMYKIWFARNYRTHVANTILLDNALATMGAGLPSAMMASLLYPGKRVMAVCGDGGFMMNSQDLETANRLHLNLVVLIIEDRGYGMIRWKQEAEGFADFGLSFENPDFVQYAESYGAKGTRVTATDDLAPILEGAFQSGGVHLIAVPVDYSENKRVLNDELKRKAIKLD